MEQKRRIRLWPAIGQAYAGTARALPQLIRITGFWLLLLSAINFALNWLLWPWRDKSVMLDAPDMATLITSTIAAASMAVAWHRLILRNEQVTSGPYLRLDAVVLRYAVAAFLLAILPMVAIDLAMRSEATGSGHWIWSVFLVTALFSFVLSARASVGLPSIALGEPIAGFTTSVLAATRGNTMRIVVGLLATILPTIAVAIAPFMFMEDGEETRLGHAVGAVYSEFAWATLGMISVSFISLCYRQLFVHPD